MNHDEYDKKCLKTMMQIREQLRLRNDIEIVREMYNLDMVTTDDYKNWFGKVAEGQKLGTLKISEEDNGYVPCCECDHRNNSCLLNLDCNFEKYCEVLNVKCNIRIPCENCTVYKVGGKEDADED